MLYKTMILEMLQDRPELYEDLRSSNRLLTAIETYATDLKARHETWRAAIRFRRPGSDPSMVASEALELAIQDLSDHLPCESRKDEAELSLDAAMGYLRRTTPPA